MRTADQFAEFRKGELCIRHDKEHYRIRAWPGPQAFTSEDGREWKRYWPEFRFVEYPTRKKKTKAVPVRQLELGLDLPPIQAPQTKAEAFDLLRQTIPYPFATALAPFQSCQWNPLVFLHFNRDFYDLLKSSPALAYYLANDRDVSLRIYRERQSFLPKLIGTKQVDLLDYVGLGCTKQMVGIVKKIRPESADMDNVRELQKVRIIPEALKALSHLESINMGVLSLVAEGGRIMRYLTPTFLADVSQERPSHYSTAIYGLFSECQRMHRQLYPRRSFPRMARLARFREYYDELAAVLTNPGVAPPASWAALPPPPMGDSEEIQAIQTHLELWEEGHQQHNCVATYVGRITSGSIYVYRVLKPQRATLAIVRQRAQWNIEELKGTCNQPVDQATFQTVKYWLDGHQLGTM